MFLSIILCVYKTEQYLKKCIDSITSQCFSNYEILIIDDGTPDENKIIDTFVGNNIRVFHKENEGLSESRNFAMKYATGKYVWFVDPDDEVEPNSLEYIYNTLISSDSDILRFNYRIIDGYNKTTTTSLPSDIYTNNKLIQLRHYIVCDSHLTMHSCWMHVYRRELIKDIEFKSYKEYAFDDILFNLECYQKAEKIETCNEIMYRYYIRVGSITKSKQFWLERIINAYTFIKKKYIELGIYSEYKDDLITTYLDVAILGRGRGHGGALAFEYQNAKDIDDAHIRVKSLINSDKFNELLEDSYGHMVDETLMKWYSCLYNRDEEKLSSLIDIDYKYDKREKVSDNFSYVLNHEFIKTKIDNEYILVPTNSNQNTYDGVITLQEDGNRMLDYIEKYKNKLIILEHLYKDYSDYSKEEIDTSFDDFVVKLMSENIIKKENI